MLQDDMPWVIGEFVWTGFVDLCRRHGMVLVMHGFDFVDILTVLVG